jgi:hypothetical protein
MKTAAPSHFPATPFALRQWMENAKPGEWCCYHEGRFAAGDICRLAMSMADKGHVTLAQRRMGETYQFMAMRLDGRRKCI